MHRIDNGQPDETKTEDWREKVLEEHMGTIDSNSLSMSVTEMNTMRDEGDLEATFTYGDLPNVKNTILEEAAHRLVTMIRAKIDLGDDQPLQPITLGPDLENLLDQADRVEDAIALAQSAVLPVPPLLEATGNVEEKELAARYMEQKQKGALFHAQRSPRLRGTFEHAAEMFRAIASDFRAGLHLPEITYEGRVIPYNETNDTGIRHEEGLRRFFQDVHTRNVKAGWWTDIDTGEPLKRSVGEMFILMVTELVEAYKAWAENNAPDDKLQQFPGLGVEMGDLMIRIADFCGGLEAGVIVEHDGLAINPGDAMFQEIVAIADRYEAIRKTPAAKGEPEMADFLPGMDVAMMVDAKLEFNASRPDHKIENRLKEGGKRT